MFRIMIIGLAALSFAQFGCASKEKHTDHEVTGSKENASGKSQEKGSMFLTSFGGLRD
jgi:hypothetical protein